MTKYELPEDPSVDDLFAWREAALLQRNTLDRQIGNDWAGLPPEMKEEIETLKADLKRCLMECEQMIQLKRGEADVVLEIQKEPQQTFSVRRFLRDLLFIGIGVAACLALVL